MTKEEIEELSRKVSDRVKDDTEGKWHRHPITLMLAGFILTGVLGSVVTSRFNNADFEKKQKLIFQENWVSKQVNLLENFSAETSVFIQGSAFMINTFWREFIQDSTLSGPDGLTEINNARKHYKEAESKWRIYNEKLKAQFHIYFNNPQLTKRFDRFQTLYDSKRIQDSSIYIMGLNVVDFDTSDYRQFRVFNSVMFSRINAFKVEYDSIRTQMLSEIESGWVFSESK